MIKTNTMETFIQADLTGIQNYITRWLFLWKFLRCEWYKNVQFLENKQYWCRTPNVTIEYQIVLIISYKSNELAKISHIV